MKLSAKAKKIIALCICCALLAVAIIQNVYTGIKDDNAATGKVESGDNADVNGEPDDSQDVLAGENQSAEEDAETVATGLKCESVADYISGLRLERDEVRSLAAEECMAIIENETSAEDDKAKAQETVQSIGMMQEIETSLETALKGKGYEDVFVIYNDQGEIDVTLVAKTLVQEEVSAIASIIHTSTGVSVGNMSLQSIYE